MSFCISSGKQQPNKCIEENGTDLFYGRRAQQTNPPLFSVRLIVKCLQESALWKPYEFLMCIGLYSLHMHYLLMRKKRGQIYFSTAKSDKYPPFSSN